MSVDPRIDQIDQIFEQWNRDDSPGMAIAVTKNGEIVHRNAYGMADLDQHICNKPETVFHCASLAKQFTAMSLLLLEGQGKITLDDDVRDYIDELDRQHIPKITIRQLLHHTSGVRDMLIQLSLAGWRWGDDEITRDHVLGLVSRMKTLNFDPGTNFAYSNTNYFLAGEIVQRKSQEKSLAEFAQNNIFGPLEMASTRFVEKHRDSLGARGHRQLEDKSFQERMPNYDLTGPTNLFTTVGDLIRWDGNFKTGKVGGLEAVKKLQEPGEKSNGYGLGLFVLRSGGKPIKSYHNGRTIGLRAHFVHDDEHKISIALLCNVEFTNVEATDHIVSEVSQIVQGRSFHTPLVDHVEAGTPSGTKPAEALEKYLGTYESSEIETRAGDKTVYEVKKKGSSLVIARPVHPEWALADDIGPRDDTFFAVRFTAVLPETEFTFVKNNNGDIDYLRLDWSGKGSRLMDFRFKKRN